MTASTAAMDRPAHPRWIDRYLGLPGLPADPPSVGALTCLVRAQIGTVVFENLTAILRREAVPEGSVPDPDPDDLLDAWIAGRGGGVCFDLAPMFRRLLEGLDYGVTPLLAQISFPGSHHATLVTCQNETYLVDVGGGWPLWQPVPLGATVEFGHVGLGFRLRPDGADAYVQERRMEADWAVACTYDLRPASADARSAAYQRHQRAGETWVVGNLTMVRSSEDGIDRLRDDELVRYRRDGKTVERLDGDAAFARVASDVFGLPGLPVAAARRSLGALHRARGAAIQ